MKIFTLLISLGLFSCAVAVRDVENDHSESRLPSEDELRLISGFEKESLTRQDINSYEKRSVEKAYEFFELLTIIANPSYDIKFREQARESSLDFVLQKQTTIRYHNEILTYGSFLEKLHSGEIALEAISAVELLNPLKHTSESEYRGKIALSFADKAMNGEMTVVLKQIEKSFGGDKKKVWEIYFAEMGLPSDEE